MRLSEMKSIVSGIPSGFTGIRKKWQELGDKAFTIEKAAILERPAVNKDGEPLIYQNGPRKGQQIPDRRLVFQLRMETGEAVVVMTNSQYLVPLFTGALDDAVPNDTNRFGDDVFIVDAPEGLMKFVPAEYEYANGKKGAVADLVEVE